MRAIRRVVMVIPDLDIPGAMAKTCVKPMRAALGRLISCLLFLIFFVMIKMNPFTISKTDVIQLWRNKNSKFFLKTRAIEPVIKVDIKI